MTPEMERFLSRIRESLNLPDAQAELIVAELRVHLESDFLDRLRLGRPEADAAREAMLEFGDATALAGELNAENALDSGRMAMLRNIGAVMLALVGFFGVFCASDPWQLMHVVERFFATNANGVVIVSGWLAPLYRGLWWMTEHLDTAWQQIVLQVVPLVAVGFLVGRIARVRGWVLALVPWFLFWVLTWQAVARGKFPFTFSTHFAAPTIQALMLVLGSYLGRRSMHWRSEIQRAPIAVSILVAAFVCLLGFSQTIEGLAATAAAIAGYACVVGLATWGILALLRRLGQGRQASAVQ
jgi:xanthosine utilization system XapX-like protein